MSAACTVYLVDGARTPFLKAGSKPGPFTPVDLAVQCGRPLLLRQLFEPDAFDQVILGCVNTFADEQNPARVAALRLGCGTAMVAFTVAINCGSGMQSIDTAYQYIREGQSDMILAGGAESLSHAPLIFGDKMVEVIGAPNRAKTALDRAPAASAFRSPMLTPVAGLVHGLTDPILELGMGQTAEIVDHLFHLTREQADAYSVESHHRLARAQKAGWLDGEVELAFDRQGNVLGPRRRAPGQSSSRQVGQALFVLQKHGEVRKSEKRGRFGGWELVR